MATADRTLTTNGQNASKGEKANRCSRSKKLTFKSLIRNSGPDSNYDNIKNSKNQTYQSFYLCQWKHTTVKGMKT